MVITDSSDRHSAYTAGLIILLNMSTKCGNSPAAADDIDIASQNLVRKCLDALEVSTNSDLVARRFLDILNSIWSSVAGQQRSPDSETRAETPSRLTRYILEIFRHPFGGESNVIGHDDYVLARFFPDHWRFLVPEPARGRALKSPVRDGPPGWSAGRICGRADKHDRENRSPPFLTKEDYEAFFRRVS